MEFAPGGTAGVFIYLAVIRDGGLEEVVIRLTESFTLFLFPVFPYSRNAASQ